MFEFKEGDLAQLSASELADYRGEVQSAYGARKEEGKLDVEFLTEIQNALSTIKGAELALAQAEIEDELAADEAPEAELEGESDEDDAEETESDGDEDEDEEDDDSNFDAEGETEVELEAEETEVADEEDVVVEVAVTAPDTFSREELSALIETTIAAALSVDDTDTTDESDGSDVPETDLSGLGQDAPAAATPEVDETPAEKRNTVTLASTGEFSREQLRKDLEVALKNTDKGTMGEMIPLGSIEFADAPKHLISEGKSVTENQLAVLESGAEFMGMTQDEALTASICCAPMDVIRELKTWCDSGSGLFSLPRIGAPHGGVHYAIPSSSCGLVVPGFTWDEECDPAAAQPDKPCQTIDCGTFEQVRVNAFGWCFEFDNGMERFDGEQLEYWLGEARCRFEIVTANRLLDLVLTHPRVAPQVAAPATSAIPVGAGSLAAEIYEILSVRFDNMRKDLTAPTLSPNVVAPRWLDDLLAIDAIRRGGDVTARVTFSQIVNSLGGTAQMIDHWQEVAANADAWPTAVQLLIHAPGVFREVHGGQMDFGLVRDSTLNAANKARIMYEEWNAVAFMGPDCSVNYVEISGMCPSGAIGPRKDNCPTP